VLCRAIRPIPPTSAGSTFSRKRSSYQHMHDRSNTHPLPLPSKCRQQPINLTSRWKSFIVDCDCGAPDQHYSPRTLSGHQANWAIPTDVDVDEAQRSQRWCSTLHCGGVGRNYRPRHDQPGRDAVISRTCRSSGGCMSAFVDARGLCRRAARCSYEEVMSELLTPMRSRRPSARN
jgi:hypothetical protein